MSAKSSSRPQPVDPQSIAATAERLRQTRTALGYTTTEMCKFMGSSSGGSAWTNYEMGRRQISLEHAKRLQRRLDLSLDWIYCGDGRGLPAELREKLQKQLLVTSQ